MAVWNNFQLPREQRQEPRPVRGVVGRAYVSGICAEAPQAGCAGVTDTEIKIARTYSDPASLSDSPLPLPNPAMTSVPLRCIGRVRYGCALNLGGNGMA